MPLSLSFASWEMGLVTPIQQNSVRFNKVTVRVQEAGTTAGELGAPQHQLSTPFLRMMEVYPSLSSHNPIGLGPTEQTEFPLGIFFAPPTSRQPCLPAQLTGMSIALEMTLDCLPGLSSSLAHRKMGRGRTWREALELWCWPLQRKIHGSNALTQGAFGPWSPSLLLW